MTNTYLDDNVMSDTSVLEERYNTWKENRLNTISELRDIADYVDKVTKKCRNSQGNCLVTNKSYA